MKKLVLALGVVAVLAAVQPAVADGVGGCQGCAWRFVPESDDECAFCEQAPCGFILCNIGEYAPGNEWCVLEGANCGEGNPQCPDPSPHGFLQNPMTPGATSLAGCDRQPFLSETWRLARVKVITPATARGKRSGLKRI